MKVFVTGGTGFVGQAVLAALHEAGHQARVLVRQPGSSRVQALVERWGIEPAAGDVLAPDSFRAALTGCGAVVHLVGIISEVGANTFENAHVAATHHVVTAAQAAGVPRYIQMSALGTRAEAASRYHQTKWVAECIVRASGLAWTVLRPSLIYGAGDQFTNLFATLARWSPVLPVMGPGTARLQPVSVEAVALAFARAVDGVAAGETLDLCGPDRLTFNAVLDTLLEVTGRRRFKLHIPLPLARMQAQFLEAVWPRLLGRAAPLNRDQLLMLQEDNIGDPGPANARFQLPVETFRDGLRRYLAPRH